jgi:dienelactone hydrolase
MKKSSTTQSFAIAAALLCATSTSSAITFTGGNHVDSNWNLSSSWTGNGGVLPTSGDNALINQNRRAFVDSNVNFGGSLTLANSSRDDHTGVVDVRTGGTFAVSTASVGTAGGSHGRIDVTGGDMTTSGSVINRDTINLSSGTLSLFNTATGGNNRALEADTNGINNSAGGVLNVTGGDLTAGAAMTSGAIQFYSAIEISAGSFSTVVQTFFAGTSLTITGDAATIALTQLNQTVGRVVDFNFNFDSDGVSTIVNSGFMSLAGATINVDGSGYGGGAGEFTLISSTNYVDGVFAGQSVTGFAGLDGVVSASGNDLILTLTERPYATELATVAALGDLTTAPLVYTDDLLPGTATTVAATDARKAIYYDALDYAGNPTRVYAYIDIPDTATAGSPVPAVVLVHGGGGTAFYEWVDLWVARGYAAISIAVEGQTDSADQPTMNTGYHIHNMPGPVRDGIYGDDDVTLEDQWMYHAVADTVLANSLLRNLPEVDAGKVGIMGVSWGGVITSTAIGIDDRFAFAIPTYGCGHKYDIPNQYGSALVDNQLYRQVWDPILRIDQATMPSMWFSWPEENNFSLDAQAATYHRVGGSHMVSLIPGLGHGHSSAWTPDDSYEFADSVLASGGDAWCEQQSLSLTGSNAEVSFRSSKPLASAELIYASGTGFTGDLSWLEQAATLIDNEDGTWTVTATLPVGTTAWALNVKSVELGTDGVPLIASSDYQEINSISFEPSSLLELDLETGVDVSIAEARMIFSGPTHAEITEFSITGESHAGSFSVLTAAPLVLDDPSALGTPVSIQFDNTVAGLSLSESATATLSVSLEALDGTINQFTLPLSSTVRTPRSVVFDTTSNWSSEQPIYSVDDVFIRNDATVTLDAVDVVASLTVADGASPTTATLSLNQGERLQVLETLALGASSGAGVVNQSSGLVYADTLDINSNGAGDSSQYNLSGGSLYVDNLLVNANGELNMTGGSLALDLSHTVSVNGDLTINGGAFISTISGLSPVFNGTGSLSLLSGSFSMNGGVGTDVIQFNQSSIEISGGALDLSGQLYVSGATDFVVIGDSASIGIERLAAASIGTFRFVFGAAGVSAIDVDYFMGLANAQVEIDGSAYTAGEGQFTLFDSTNLTTLLNPSNITITGFDLQNKDAYVIQDQANGTDWVQLVVEDLLSNGVTKRWMRENGLPETNEATLLDSDGDGSFNWEEFEAGTGPNDNSSKFVVEQVDLSEEQLTVYWQAVSGKTYALQHKADLSDSSWTTQLTNLLGVEPQSSVTIGVNGTKGFYQIAVE